MLRCSPEADGSSAVTSRRDKKRFAGVTIKTSRKRPETACEKSLAPRVEHKVIFKKNLIESDNRELIRGTQREYSSKPLEHSIVKRILVLKR